jgi:hypothetical protein
VKKRSDPTQIVREIYDKLSLDERYGGSLDGMLATPMLQLDEELLAPKRHWSGDGGLHSPLRGALSDFSIFVVIPTRGRRVLERHDTLGPTVKYDETRGLVEGALSTLALIRLWSCRTGSASASVHLPSAMSTAGKSGPTQTYRERYVPFVQVGKHYCQETGSQVRGLPPGIDAEAERPGKITGIMWA